jgi:hypothetical protein
MSRKSNLRLARLQSRVRFSPQKQALAGVLLELQSNYKAQVAASRGAARATQAAVGAARPEILAAYRNADAQRQAIGADIAPFLDQLGTGGSAGIVRAGIGRERAMGATHLAEAEAASLGELARRKVQAASGGQYGVRAAGDQLRADTLKTAQQLSALAGQKGAFTAATLESLASADKKLGVQRRGQDVTRRGQDLAHQDRQAANRRQAAKDRYARQHPKGSKPKAEPVSSHNFKATINDVRSIIREQRAAGKKPHEIRSLALTSKSASSRGFRTALNAAMDLEYRGGLSRPNVVALRQAGVRVPRGWRHPRPARPVGGAFGGAVRL